MRIMLALIAAAAAVLAFTATALTRGQSVAAAPAEGKAATSLEPRSFGSAAFPNADDGKPIMLMGLEGWDYTSLEQPYIDLTKLSGGEWTAIGGPEEVPFAELWNAGLIDPNTLLPKAIPQGSKAVRSTLFRFGARFYPRYYAGNYILEWEGDADLRFGFGHANQKRNNNRVEAYYHPEDRDWINFEITRIGKGGLQSVRLYRKENEARLQAGEVFDPEFVAYASKYKILRSLDIQSGVITDIRSVSRLKRKGQYGYGGSATAKKGAPDAPVGAPIEALFDMAMATDTALWLHAPTLLGAPPVFDDLGIESPRRDDLRATAKAKKKEIFASPEWRSFADEVVRSASASGYPADRMLYVEVSNEVWNFAHPFWWPTNYFMGIGDTMGAGQSHGVGYALAHMTVALDEAFTAAERKQAWTPVFAGQMANIETTKGGLAGFKRYFVDRGIDPAPWMARLGVSTATYYHDALEPDGLLTIPPGADYKQTWLDAIKSDPKGLARKMTDWYLKGSDRRVGTIPYLVRMRGEHQKLAEAAGAFLVGDYEGESHENGGGPLKSEPVYVNWFEDWKFGPEGERLTRGWIEALYEQNPDAVIANYKGIGAADPEGSAPTDRSLAAPWYDSFYDEENGRTRALDAFLRAPKS